MGRHWRNDHHKSEDGLTLSRRWILQEVREKRMAGKSHANFLPNFLNEVQDDEKRGLIEVQTEKKIFGMMILGLK